MYVRVNTPHHNIECNNYALASDNNMWDMIAY